MEMNQQESDYCSGLHHEESEWNHVPFLLYCGDTKLVSDMPSRKKCFLTDSEAAVKKFAVEGRL